MDVVEGVTGMERGGKECTGGGTHRRETEATTGRGEGKYG